MASVRYEILDLLTEDNYGPWELLIQVEHPRDVVTAELEILLRVGAVEWMSRDGFRGETRAATPAEYPSIHAEATWVPSELEENQLLVGITEIGMNEYSKLMRSEFDWPPQTQVD
jgi:hypothetical protein